jgi:hypothetical protein
VTVLAFLLAAYVVELLRYREAAVAEVTLGSGGLVLGTVVTFVQAIKFFTLEMILALGVWISGWTIADTADELLGWFDKYDDSTDDEGTQKQSPFARDATGTSILFDLIFHSVTAVYSLFVLSSIMVGGYIFAFVFASFGGPLGNCDLSSADAADYSKDGVLFVDGLLPNLNQGTLQECKDNMKLMFKALDVSGDGYIDRCEDAKFLKASGASDDYALNYPGSASLYELQNMCYMIVPDAYEEMPDMFTQILNALTGWLGGDHHHHEHSHDDDADSA